MFSQTSLNAIKRTLFKEMSRVHDVIAQEANEGRRRALQEQYNELETALLEAQLSDATYVGKDSL